MDAASLAGARSCRENGCHQPGRERHHDGAELFRGEFPQQFLGLHCPVPTVAVWQDSVNTHIRYVQVTGNVTTPLYFLRTVGFTTAALRPPPRRSAAM